MDLTLTEIKKISRKFKISETDIIDFLASEERLILISSLKKAFLENTNQENKLKISKEWLKECKKFSDFEDFYIIVSNEQLSEQFFLDWLRAGKGYKERRDVYRCITEDKYFREKFIKTWIELASDLEDIREALSYVDKSKEEYKTGIKKITQIYKN